MSNSTTNLDLIQNNQAQKELTANQLFDAMSPSSTFGRRGFACSLLTWAGYGGVVNFNGTILSFDNFTFQLVASTTNFLEFSHDTQTVSLNQTAFSTNATPLYQIITGSNSVLNYTDKRNFLKINTTASYTLPTATSSILGGVKVDGSTQNISIDSGGVISTNKATSGQIGAVKPDGATISVDSSGVLSVNKATSGQIGAVKPDGTTITIDSDGVITQHSSGGGGGSGVQKIIAGSNISISSSGADGTGDVTINSTGGGGGSSETTFHWVIPAWSTASYYYFYSSTNLSGSTVNGNSSLNSTEISLLQSKASDPSNFKVRAFLKCLSGSGASDSNGYYTDNVIVVDLNNVQAGIHKGAGALLLCLNNSFQINARISLIGPVGQSYPITPANWELHVVFDVKN